MVDLEGVLSEHSRRGLKHSEWFSPVLEHIQKNDKLDKMVRNYSTAKAKPFIKKLCYPFLGAVPFIQRHFDERYDWYDSLSATKISGTVQGICSVIYSIYAMPPEGLAEIPIGSIGSLPLIGMLSIWDGFRRSGKSSSTLKNVKTVFNFINDKPVPISPPELVSDIRDLERSDTQGYGIFESFYRGIRSFVEGKFHKERGEVYTSY